MTLPEVLFWKAVRGRSSRLKFRRQHPFGPFIIDFYCLELKLAVEIDSSFHATRERAEHDARRDAFLRAHGVRVHRVPAGAVLNDIDGVLEVIYDKFLPRPKGP